MLNYQSVNEAHTTADWRAAALIAALLAFALACELIAWVARR